MVVKEVDAQEMKTRLDAGEDVARNTEIESRNHSCVQVARPPQPISLLHFLFHLTNRSSI